MRPNFSSQIYNMVPKNLMLSQLRNGIATKNKQKWTVLGLRTSPNLPAKHTDAA